MARQAAREASWSSMHHSEVSDEEPESDEELDHMSVDDISEAEGVKDPTQIERFDTLRLNADSEQLSPMPPTLSDVRRSLHPLRSAAERVGKQVEQFAEHLDRYNENRVRKKYKDCRQVFPLVNGYRKIANDTVKYLRGVHSPVQALQDEGTTRARTLRSSSGKPISTSFNAGQGEGQGTRTTMKDLRIWEQEAQSWDLLASMLQVEFPMPRAESETLAAHQQPKRPDRDTKVYRYSSEKAAWDRFLAEDDLAWERFTVVEWLKKCADYSGHDIETVVKELDAGADDGELTADSWMHSRLAIKQQKRSQVWTQALDPDNPGIELFVSDSDNTKDLITQLDPDAITRQGRDLETQDSYNERAIWLACWEMMRRGKDWSYIQGWCQERAEGWRAIALRGDPRASAASTPLANGWQSRALWRHTCAAAAKRGLVDKYENAVYGLLGGHLPSVLKVCGSWNDFVFAHYNAYLLAQFDDFVKEQLPDRVPRTLAQKSETLDLKSSEDHRDQSGKQIVNKMKKLDSIKKQAMTLEKMLQGSLIAKTFDEFVVEQGAQLGHSANAQQKSKIITEPTGEATKVLERNLTLPISLHDYDMLRVVTHIFFVFQDLGLKIRDADCNSAAENIIAAYVDFLSKAGKQQLLPLYASRLSPARATDCLARQLPLIQEHTERQTVMSLMDRSGIDVPEVLTKQLQLIILDAPSRPRGSMLFPQLEILEPAGNHIGRARPIKKAFIGQFIPDDEQDLINGFQWYSLLEGHWELTMNMGTIVYKHFLRHGSLAAGRELARNMSFSQLSQIKTQHLLGSIVDLSKEPAHGDTDRYRSVSGSRDMSCPVRADREYLLSKARSFRDLETLFVALDALERWKDIADRMLGLAGRQAEALSEEKGFMGKTLEEIEVAIAPLLQGWLQDPQDEEEATQFEAIRTACLPEVVLAYAHVLDISARFLTRDLLLRSMDLAATIAAEGADIATCFVDAGRMAELVTSFAFASQAIIRAEESGGKGTKSKRQQSLEIWSTKAKP